MPNIRIVGLTELTEKKKGEELRNNARKFPRAKGSKFPH